MTDDAPILLIERLSKSFGALKAVDDVSFKVAAGEIVGLLGPNGAGKTTTINMALGVLQPSAGASRSKASICSGAAAVRSPTPIRRRQLPAARQSHRRAEPKSFGMIYGVPDLGRRLDELIGEFDLTRLRKTKAGVLSSGEQTRLNLAKAMLNRPRLLMLDEPTASDRPIWRARNSYLDRRLRRRRPRRRAVDEPQHDGGRSGVRPRAVPFARPHRARGRPENPTGEEWRRGPRGPLRFRRQGKAAAGGAR